MLIILEMVLDRNNFQFINYSHNQRLQLCKHHFLFEALSIKQPPKYSASKGTCCRHSCNFGFNFMDTFLHLFNAQQEK